MSRLRQQPQGRNGDLDAAAYGQAGSLEKVEMMLGKLEKRGSLAAALADGLLQHMACTCVPAGSCWSWYSGRKQCLGRSGRKLRTQDSI